MCTWSLENSLMAYFMLEPCFVNNNSRNSWDCLRIRQRLSRLMQMLHQKENKRYKKNLQTDMDLERQRTILPISWKDSSQRVFLIDFEDFGGKYLKPETNLTVCFLVDSSSSIPQYMTISLPQIIYLCKQRLASKNRLRKVQSVEGFFISCWEVLRCFFYQVYSTTSVFQ